MPDARPAVCTLRDGRDIFVREIGPGDRALVEDGFRHLSERSRFLRFRGVKTALSEDEMNRLTDPTDRDDVALGAILAGRHPVPVGVARFFRLAPSGAVAEIAVTVVDHFQGFGAGTLLLETLASVAQGCGITDFTAFVDLRNRPMRSLAARYDATETGLGGTELELHIRVGAVIGRSYGNRSRKKAP